MSGDPSQVDSRTLKLSLLSDLKAASHSLDLENLVAASRWLTEAQVTLNELLRREGRDYWEEVKSRS